MTSRLQPFQQIIAFEVAKTSLTIHVLPADRQESIANTPAAVRRVLRRERVLDRTARRCIVRMPSKEYSLRYSFDGIS